MGSSESGEAALWLRSLNGDGEAFGRVFDRHRGRVFRHAYRLCGERHDAEDVMSAAFLELWRRRDSVRLVEGSVLPWLLVTTTNLARNSKRSVFRYRRLLNSLPRTEDVSQVTGESVFLDAMESDVANALRTLNALDMQLVSLVVFEDYTLAAAAAVLNLTPGAAKTRMHRARQRMKKAIVREGKPVPAAELEGELS
ncbi:sigma-70 family RNA polymerase sigma factor [Arthrobacter sp.]|uniref:RNA polymerase sigma factor n=1 Tax=Arthrobacter sp. TaxID=1667 RepID=UPI0028123238|nr:sigma-70 family RNA polymerase sigma factor [Arthrobacter sp.]